MKIIKKCWYKLRLKSTYKTIINITDDYDCGHHMLLIVSSTYFNRCTTYNKLADKLKQYDNNVPSFRYNLNP